MATGPLSDGLDSAKLKQAVDAAFEPSKAMTAAFVVTWKGRVIAERYGEGVTKDTALESWSMGKSVSATLMGIMIRQGVYLLSQPAPIPEWSDPKDPRRAITIADLLHMSSGLRIKARNDPDYDPKGTYPDHLYLFTGDENLFHYAATRPLEWPPNTVGRYRNTNPMLINYLIRLGVEGRKGRYHAFPRRALFDKLGMRSMVLETDTYGNFLTQGYVLASARDWARLAESLPSRRSVERREQPNPHHKRAPLLVLTDRGQRVFEAATGLQAPWVNGLAEGTKVQEVEAALRVLQKLCGRLEENEPSSQ